MLETKSKLKILDFDIENRPLTYWTPDRPTAEITAIASCWTDDLWSMRVYALNYVSYKQMLEFFVDRYNEADVVTGHYIRKHDLPMINGALLELGMPQLGPKLTCDTRLDMRTKGDIPATQEYLGEVLGVSIEKMHMTQSMWREANRLTSKGIDLTINRVSTDVRQHMLIREKMVELDLLKPMKVWTP